MEKIKVLLMVSMVVLVVSIEACAKAQTDVVTTEQIAACFADTPTIQPRYSYTNKAVAELSFSGGKANCGGYVQPSGKYDTSVTVTLYKKNGTKWDYITSWSGSATGGHMAIASGSITVSRGTYKVVTSGNVQNLEYPSAKIERTY